MEVEAGTAPTSGEPATAREWLPAMVIRPEPAAWAGEVIAISDARPRTPLVTSAPTRDIFISPPPCGPVDIPVEVAPVARWSPKMATRSARHYCLCCGYVVKIPMTR